MCCLSVRDEEDAVLGTFRITRHTTELSVSPE
jgi:hypothetical protein